MSFKRRFLICYFWTAGLYIGYQITNHFHVFTPHMLEPTIIDLNIPFTVWTVYPYFMLLNLVYLPIFIKDKIYFYKALLAMGVAVSINYTIYTIYPTVLERPITPIGETYADLLYRWLISIDTPANCFPSGHITSPFIACWFFVKYRPKTKILTYGIFVLLSVSVLTTKQHYFFDILGGLTTASIAIYIVEKTKTFERILKRII